MSGRLRHFLMALAGVALAACGPAEEAPPFPHFSDEGGRVRDMAEILSPETEKDLAARLERAETLYGQELGIVTVDSLHGYRIEDFSLQYANAWGLGSEDRHDGLLVLVAPNERKVRVEVGRGLETTFPDPFAQNVVDAMLPFFREQDYDKGVAAAVELLIARMRQYPSRPANDNAPEAHEDAA